MTETGACAGFKNNRRETQAKLGTESRGESRPGNSAFSPGQVKISASKSGVFILAGRRSLPPALRQLTGQMGHDERHDDTDGIATEGGPADD